MEVGSSGYDGGVKIIHINMYIYILYVHDAIDIVILIWERKCIYIYIYMQKTTKTMYIYIIYIYNWWSMGQVWVKSLGTFVEPQKSRNCSVACFSNNNFDKPIPSYNVDNISFHMY